MMSILNKPQLIAKTICLFIILYVSLDLPKLYFTILILFTIFYYYEKINFKRYELYLIPIFLVFFYLEPQLEPGYSGIIIYDTIWGITALLISIITFHSLEKRIITLENIFLTIFIGSLISIIVVFFIHIFIFDYPITRNGFIHPLSKFNDKYLLLSLENLKYINPVNIRSLYEVIEISFLLSLILISIKEKNFFFIFINVIIFILGCSFGSRLFVLFCMSSNILMIIFDKKKTIFLIILVLNSIMFFSNITIYSFVKHESYINTFKNEDTVFKKIKSYNLIYENNDVLSHHSSRPISLLFENSKEKNYYLEDSYLAYDKKENISTKSDIVFYTSHITKYTESVSKIFKEKEPSFQLQKNYYSNKFTVNIDTFETSHHRFFDKASNINKTNRLYVIIKSFVNINLSNEIILNNPSDKRFKNIYPSNTIIYHNLMLDTFYMGSILSAIILLFIYIKMLFHFLISIFRKLNLLPFVFSYYFIYDQFIQTSLLTGNKSFFLFTIAYTIIYFMIKESNHNIFLKQK